MSESWEIWRIAEHVEAARYSDAAAAAHDLEAGVLRDLQANLEFCLDIVGQELRQRKWYHNAG